MKQINIRKFKLRSVFAMTTFLFLFGYLISNEISKILDNVDMFFMLLLLAFN